MSGVVFPLAATIVAAGLTYWCCVRPMRRSRGCLLAKPSSDATPNIDAELAQPRAELQRLQSTSPPTQQPRAGAETGLPQSPHHPS